MRLSGGSEDFPDRAASLCVVVDRGVFQIVRLSIKCHIRLQAPFSAFGILTCLKQTSKKTPPMAPSCGVGVPEVLEGMNHESRDAGCSFATGSVIF